MWRNHPLFVYGWLPVRALALGLGFVVIPIIWLAVALQWLQVTRANNTVYQYIYGDGKD